MAALRFVAGPALGWATSWSVLTGSFALLRLIWPAYASAEPERAYTPPMLLARLLVFAAMIAATSGVATVVARDMRLAWIASGLILALSLPPHLYPGYLWDDHPAWYDIVYLLSILPIAALAGRFVRRRHPAIFVAASSARRGLAGDPSTPR